MAEICCTECGATAFGGAVGNGTGSLFSGGHAAESLALLIRRVLGTRPTQVATVRTQRLTAARRCGWPVPPRSIVRVYYGRNVSSSRKYNKYSTTYLSRLTDPASFYYCVRSFGTCNCSSSAVAPPRVLVRLSTLRQVFLSLCHAATDCCQQVSTYQSTLLRWTTLVGPQLTVQHLKREHQVCSIRGDTQLKVEENSLTIAGRCSCGNPSGPVHVALELKRKYRRASYCVPRQQHDGAVSYCRRSLAMLFTTCTRRCALSERPSKFFFPTTVITAAP